MPPLVGAACRAPSVDPKWFFPARGEPIDRALAVCARCPSATRSECLEYAMSVGQSLMGVWGGVSEVGRRRLKRKRLLADDGTVLDLSPVEGEPESVTDPVPVSDVHLSKDEGTGSARQCSECGGPLAENRQYTCGPECARTRKVRVKHAAPDPRRNHRPREDVADQTPSSPVLEPVSVSAGHENGSSPVPVASSALEGLTEGGLQLRSADERGIAAITPLPIVEGALELVRLASGSGQAVELELRAGSVRLSITERRTLPR